MTKIYESDIENFAIELLQKQWYSYLPPGKQKLATENILKQAELFADEWSS